MEGIKETLQERMATIELHGFDPISAGGFTQIPNVILKNKKLSMSAKYIYSMLLYYAWQKDSCFPGQEKLAEDIGLKERQVRTYIRELEKEGFLSTKRRGQGKTNVYYLYARVRKTKVGK